MSKLRVDELESLATGRTISVDNIDAGLRQDLASPDKGAAMVARGVVAVDSIADLLALSEEQKVEGLRYLVKGYYDGSGVGGGEFYWDAYRDRGEADGGRVVDPAALGGFDGTPSSRDGFISTQGSGSGSGCFVLLSVPNQMNYGCVGDGSFDDSDAVQKAIDARVTFIDKEHGITKSLYVYDSIDMSAATFKCDNKPIAYLTFGDDTNYTRCKKVGFPFMWNIYNTTFQVDGVNPSSVGIRIMGAHESMFSFHPQGIYAFGVGVELLSTGPGIAYCEFHNIRTIGCFKHILFHNINDGWITENLFLKTKTVNYDNFAPTGMDLTGLGYNYICVDNKSTLVNQAVENITFIQPTLEGVYVSDHLSLENGTAYGWVMVSPRFEVPGGTFKMKGGIRTQLINPAHSEQVEGLIGTDKYQTFGDFAIGVSNAPIILGSSDGDRAKQGIGLLNENLDFSGRLVSSFTPADPDDFVWNISKTGFYARGLTANPVSPVQLALNFLGRSIEWAAERFAPGSTVVGIKAEEIYGPTLGCLTVDADVLQAKDDGASDLGRAAKRWANIYATNAVISTSDERSKQQIKPIDDAALRAWARVEYMQYKFNDAIEKKGEGARWHFGLIAQRVKEAFEAEGLDAFEYGLLCYDEWEEVPEVLEQVDEEGNVVVEAIPYQPAGSRYGIRYEEALALECAYLRSRIS